MRLRRQKPVVLMAVAAVAGSLTVLLFAAACLGVVEVTTWLPPDNEIAVGRLEGVADNQGEQPVFDEGQFLESLPLSTSYDVWPSSSSLSSSDVVDDRILAQLRYIPRSYNRSNVKVIYVPNGLGNIPSGQTRFLLDRCPVDACTLTVRSRYEFSADVRLLRGDAFFDRGYRKPRGQIWVLWLLESPVNTPKFGNAERLINWTATYRPDSTIVTPYDKYVDFERLGQSEAVHLSPKWPYPPRVAMASRSRPANRNYAAGKHRLVAWFASNCVAANRRYEFVQQLRQHIPVDVYGDCGTLGCSRDEQSKCDQTLRRTYKFYLAFENSNCEHYVTEKFYHNALRNDVVPVVMGGHKSDYLAVAPPHSFIHVEDFQSVGDLADYLLQLNASDSQYNKYLAWKDARRGQFVNTRFWCRLCAMAHDDSGHVSWYEDIDAWWRRPLVCTRDRWDRHADLIHRWTAT